MNGLGNANTKKEMVRIKILERLERSEDAAPFASEIMVKTAMKRPSSNNTLRTTISEHE